MDRYLKRTVDAIADRWDGTNVRRISALTAGMKTPEVRELRRMVMTARRDVGWLVSRLEEYDRQSPQAVRESQQRPGP